jgi:transcriptional regulator with XRE-family HTH domain
MASQQDKGAIVERVVRRSGISIAELARRIKVDRRSIYYWFKQENLDAVTITKLGRALSYDFKQDFPDMALEENETFIPSLAPTEEVLHWKTKYIGLLENYNYLLQEQRMRVNR